jgi:1-acyl-sn-glycerol-3-phosphate acyltransferase
VHPPASALLREPLRLFFGSGARSLPNRRLAARDRGAYAGLRLNGPIYRLIRGAVRGLARVLFRLRVVGLERLERLGPAVFVANHISWLDPIIVPLVLPRKPGFLAMEELWRMPGVAFVMRTYGPLAIPLRRGAVDTTALRRATEALRGGAWLIIFPEGGIAPDGVLKPFHRGASMLAARTGAPLVPVAIVGTSDALPLGRVIPRRRPITVYIGEPITVPRGDRSALGDAGEQAAAQIRSLLAAARTEPR